MLDAGRDRRGRRSPGMLDTRGIPDPDLVIRTSGERGSPISCCGRRPTRSSSSCRTTGRISTRDASRRPSTNIARRDRRFGGLERQGQLRWPARERRLRAARERRDIRSDARRRGSFSAARPRRVVGARRAVLVGGLTFALFWLAAGLAILLEWTAMTRRTAADRCEACSALGLDRPCARLLAAVAALGLARSPGRGGARGLHGRRESARSLMGRRRLRLRAVLALAPTIVRDHPQAGVVGVLWLFAVVWTTDIAAYFAGRAVGGPKLWPRVSPKKTWSGVRRRPVAARRWPGALVALLGHRCGGPSAGVFARRPGLRRRLGFGQAGRSCRIRPEAALRRQGFGLRSSPATAASWIGSTRFWPVALFAALIAGVGRVNRRGV